MNSNFSLFFYGVGSKFVQFIGLIGVLLSFWVLAFAGNNIAFFIILIFGLGIWYYGRAMRFDYQRNSGSIIHRGDW